jgi:hypothetical protein
MSTITITFCDQGENHVGNQKIGKLAESGYSYEELSNIQLQLKEINVTSELVNLGDFLPDQYDKIDAGILIIRNCASIFVENVNDIYEELKGLDWDKKALMYGQVRNKHARHNLCFADTGQKAEYELGKGTIVSFEHLKYLSHIRKYLHVLFGNKAENLIAEGNYYYDSKKCGIGPHGDFERKIVIGLRLGENFPLCFYWYLNNERVSQRIDFNFNSGDIYIMDEKACGHDWKKRSILTLRHAAGSDKYIK